MVKSRFKKSNIDFWTLFSVVMHTDEPTKHSLQGGVCTWRKPAEGFGFSSSLRDLKLSVCRGREHQGHSSMGVFVSLHYIHLLSSACIQSQPLHSRTKLSARLYAALKDDSLSCLCKYDMSKTAASFKCSVVWVTG